VGGRSTIGIVSADAADITTVVELWELLTNSGFKQMLVGDGLAAMEIFQGDPPAAVIVIERDPDAPLEFARAMNAACPDVPMVLLTRGADLQGAVGELFAAVHFVPSYDRALLLSDTIRLAHGRSGAQRRPVLPQSSEPEEDVG
jgi:DNA-binding NtrC family response regulator